VFLVFAIFETRLPQFSNSSSLAGNIIFFLLINLNLILLVLLVFLVTRNLVRLVFERRRGIFGSRLRTRLVLAFIGLSLVPSLLLFLVARGFVDAAIENWFNVRIESSLRTGSTCASKARWKGPRRWRRATTSSPPTTPCTSPSRSATGPRTAACW
jgi:nitrogen fixation/metabolism regulation signal transduction histidine kinase